MGCASSTAASAGGDGLVTPAPADASVGAASAAADPDSYANLAKETHFTTEEVEALAELYSKLSNELHRDNLIHRDEFMWALFKANRDNLFAERVFELFDIKQNHVIEFGEFVRSLSVFHPKAPLEDKARFAFRIYDIGSTGAIERPELKRFLVALMADNPDVDLDEQALDEIVDETFAELDLTKDGVINPEEWLHLVRRNPDIISYMTLPVLTTLCQRYPTPGALSKNRRRSRNYTEAYGASPMRPMLAAGGQQRL